MIENSCVPMVASDQRSSGRLKIEDSWQSRSEIIWSAFVGFRGDIGGLTTSVAIGCAVPAHARQSEQVPSVLAQSQPSG